MLDILNLPPWALAALLGLGLAAATGLRTFLPLLALALVMRFGVFGLELKDEMAWLVSDLAVAALGIASAVEFLGDKIPWLDRGLNLLGYVARPVAGAVAVYAVMTGFDPLIAAIGALIIGAPTALAFSALQGGDRLKRDRPKDERGFRKLSNAAVSLIVDVLAIVALVAAFTVPALTPVLVVVLLVAVFWVARRMTRVRGADPNGLSRQPS